MMERDKFKTYDESKKKFLHPLKISHPFQFEKGTLFACLEPICEDLFLILAFRDLAITISIY